MWRNIFSAFGAKQWGKNTVSLFKMVKFESMLVSVDTCNDYVYRKCVYVYRLWFLFKNTEISIDTIVLVGFVQLSIHLVVHDAIAGFIRVGFMCVLT